MRPSDLAAVAGNDLARAAERAGCRVVARGTLRDGGRTWPVVEMECPDNAAAIRFLNEAAPLDASDPEVRDLALRLRRAHPELVAFLRAVQAFVKAGARFLREARETFQHTLYTLRRRAGDCDDHARAVVALAVAGGAKGRVVGVANSQGKVAHVAPVVFDGTRWQWAETTIDASFGEHPRAAARRLGVIRPDIWSERRTTEGSRAAHRG